MYDKCWVSSGIDNDQCFVNEIKSISKKVDGDSLAPKERLKALEQLGCLNIILPQRHVEALDAYAKAYEYSTEVATKEYQRDLLAKLIIAKLKVSKLEECDIFLGTKKYPNPGEYLEYL